MKFFDAKEALTDDAEAREAKNAPAKPKSARFPEDLVPAARYKPIADASIYSPKHLAKMAFLAPAGSRHSWHEALESVNDLWLATNVEA
jgi:hypothetical protein